MQTALIIVLAVLVAVLATLLIVRHRREKQLTGLMNETGLQQYAELIRASILEGDIQMAATHVSRMLRELCGCERIVFLRCRGRFLELSYYYGITGFNRRALQARYTGELVEILRSNPLPDTVERLKGILPDRLMESLHQWGCDLFFPIFWRDRLYGLYFVASNAEVRAPAFCLVIASMAQALSAAYHVKWQEQEYGRLQERMNAVESTRKRRRTETLITSAGLLKLVRHRDSETLVGRIIDEVRKDLELDRCAYFYSDRNPDEPVRLHGDGFRLHVQPPPRESFERLVERLRPDTVLEVSEISRDDETLAPLEEGLRQAGLSYVAPFRLTGERPGLLAWADKRQPTEVMASLSFHRATAEELMANARSFEEVESLSYTDGLTGLANQRYFNRRLEEEIDRARRYRRSLALIIFDLDDLKGVNDRYGHQAGNEVLRQMGEMLGKSIRSIDVVARYGGDEFCVIMPESDRSMCARFMQRLKQKIAGARFRLDQLDKEVTCTVSLGGAVFPDHADTSEKLIYAADMALLKAKESGRNRSVVN